MEAVRWHAAGDLRLEDVELSLPLGPGMIEVEVAYCGICGSDLHLYGGIMPGMKEGDIVGHEPMGEVVEVGRDVTNLKKGDRVVVPFTIAGAQRRAFEPFVVALVDMRVIDDADIERTFLERGDLRHRAHRAQVERHRLVALAAARQERARDRGPGHGQGAVDCTFAGRVSPEQLRANVT